MKHFTIISFVALLTLGVSCTSEPNASQFVDVNGDQVLVCNMNKVTDTIDFPLSNLLESCEMVRLETTDGAFFDRARFVDISENYIIIKSAGRFPVKLFDRSGKFIREIGAIGKGPGEYTSIYGIQLDEINECIYLTPFARAKKIMVYNIQGEQLPDISLAIQSGKVRTFIEGGVLTALCLPFPKDQAIVFQQELDGSLIQKVEPKEYLTARDFNSEVFSGNNSGNFEFHNTQCDTLFAYDQTGNRLIPKFSLIKPSDEKVYASMFSFPNHYFVWVGASGRLLVDRKSGESHYAQLVNDFYGGFKGDFWGGFNGNFVNVIAAIDLKDKITEALKKKNLSSTDREILQKIDSETNEDDSPIVFFGKYIK